MVSRLRYSSRYDMRTVFQCTVAFALTACGGTDGAKTTPTMPVTPVVATIVVASPTSSLVPGQPQQLTAVARDASGNLMTGVTLTWASSVGTVATVTTDGRISAVTPGASTITASSGNVTGATTVTVVDGGYITASGGTITALDGEFRLELTSGAVPMPTAFVVRKATTVPTNERLLPTTVFTIEPVLTFTSPATLRVRYPATLDVSVVETQLRLARVAGAAWSEYDVQPVDRSSRVASAAVTSTGTFGVFIPPPSLRSLAQRRGFDFGSAVSAFALRTDSAYRRVLGAEFNFATAENAMKFGDIHPASGVYAFSDADTVVGYAVANGMKLHGHVLLYHDQQPAWLTAGTPTRTSLLAILKEHIETVVGRYAGKISSWDVANQLIDDDTGGLRQSFWITVVGPDVIDSAFVWTRRKDPVAKLYLGDFSVEAINRKSDAMLALAKRLRASGIPIDGIGIQAILSFPLATSAQVTANLARFAAENFDIRITQLDVRLANGTDGLAEQAVGFGNMTAACLAQPRCKSVTTWGFTDQWSWIPGAFTGFGRALPFDLRYAPKPAYTALRDVLGRP